MAEVLMPLQPLSGSVFGDESKYNDEDGTFHAEPCLTEKSRSKLETETSSSSSRSVSVVQQASGSAKKCSVVTFGSIVIREYSMTLGDNPCVSYGAPVQLDWDYHEHESLSLDDYEENRQTRRTMRQMILNYYKRCEILQDAGFTANDMRKAQLQVNRDKRRRSQTRAMQPPSELTIAIEAIKKLFGECKSKKAVRE